MAETSWRRRVLPRVVLYGGFLFIGLPLAFSEVMVRPYHQPTNKAHAPWEEITVPCEGLKLRAWLRRGDVARPAVLFAHGVGDSLESWTELGKEMHARGHTALLLDLRGHGGSEGKYTTLGARERADVRAAMGVLTERHLADKGIVLWGASMGAVSVLRAAEGRSDVRAVLAEAPYDTFRDNIGHHAELFFHMPRWFPLVPLAIKAAEWRAGFDADAVDVPAAARGIRAPILLIVDGIDPRMPEPVVRRIYDAHPGPKKLWVAAGADHTGASLNKDFAKVVGDFLNDSGI